MKLSKTSLTKYIYVICILMLSFFTVPSNAQTINNLNDLVLYLDSKDSAYENICIEYGKETWDLYSMEDESNLKIPKEKLAAFLQDKDFIENIDYWSRNENSIEDEILKRRVVVFNNIINGTKIELDSEVREKTTYLLEAMRNRNKEDSLQNIELENQVKELIKLRNKKARLYGYDNYADFLLDDYGIGFQWFKEFTELLDAKSEPVYNELINIIKQEKDTVKYQDIMKYLKRGQSQVYSVDSTIMILRETMSDIGYNYDSLPIRFVIKEADFGGNCIGVTIPSDIRVIMVPGMSPPVFLHELGHGLHGIFTKTPYAILKGYEWCFGNTPQVFAEGLADMLSAFSNHKEWLKKFTAMTDEEIENDLKIDKYSSAVWMRVNLFSVLAEIEVYRNENENHRELVNNLYKKIFKVDENRKRTYNLLNTIFIDYPCYLQNYTIAEIISYQIHKTLREKFGENYVNNKEVSKFLTDNFYQYGVAKDWREILKEATGTELDVEGYFRYLGLLN